MCCLTAAGPVDAAYKAIDGLVRVDAELVDYSVNSVTEGIQALATTRVNIRPTGAMKDEAYVERAGGLGGKVQRTFSGDQASRARLGAGQCCTGVDEQCNSRRIAVTEVQVVLSHPATAGQPLWSTDVFAAAAVAMQVKVQMKT